MKIEPLALFFVVMIVLVIVLPENKDSQISFEDSLITREDSIRMVFTHGEIYYLRRVVEENMDPRLSYTHLKTIWEETSDTTIQVYQFYYNEVNQRSPHCIKATIRITGKTPRPADILTLDLFPYSENIDL